MLVPNLGIHESHRAEIAKWLHVLLADEILLYLKTRNFHWNVTGPGFQDYHRLFESQNITLSDNADQVAERIRALGFKVDSEMLHLLEISQVKDQLSADSALIMVQTLLHDHELIIRHIRDQVVLMEKEFKDAGSTGLLVSVMEIHEKMAWTLRAYLE